MKRTYLLILAACVPVLAYAAGGTARSVFDAVPAIPQNAQAAYGQWIDNDGDLKPGIPFKALEDSILKATMQNLGGPSVQQQQAIAAQYNTPEARARMQNMSPAEAMAMAQQMQAQMGYTPPTATTVSDHDGALLRQINVYDKAGEVLQKVNAIRTASVKIDQQWNAAKNALGEQETAERNKLPACGGESGEPSSLATRTVMLKYADKRITLAGTYAAKYAPFVQQMKQALQPEIDHGDNAAAQWAKLQNPALKSNIQGAATAARNAGYTDASTQLSYVEGVSRNMAAEVADKKRIERMYADAQACN